jgi:DNA-binding XRE family transcriptional regulator
VGRRIKGIEDQGTGSGPARLASITFGRALQKLRHSDGGNPSSDDLAPDLGIAGSTLRMIESGSHIPAADIAYGMAKRFELALAPTFTVVGFVRTVDTHEQLEGRIAVAQIMREQEPRIAFFADAVIQAAEALLSGKKSSSVRENILGNSRLVTQLLDFLRAPLGSTVRMTRSTLAPVEENLSPLFVDALLQLSASLKVFNPTLDLAALSKWEKSVEGRIARICGYHRDPKVLLATFANSNWAFLRNRKGDHPKYVLVSPTDDPQPAYDFVAKLKTRYRDLPDDTVSVVTSLENPLNDLFDKALWFDTYEGKSCITHTTMTTSDFKRFPAQYKQLHNLLLYSIEVQNEFARLTQCAFADNATVRRQPTARSDDFYARALGYQDTQAIAALFQKIID